MKEIASFISGNWELVLLYFGVVVVVLASIYLMLASVNIAAKRRNAELLYELLTAAGWADMVKLIRNEEYVQAVMDACEIVMEG